MPLDRKSDLHWTAFLYVSGELSPTESEEFERRLDDDQSAREAVASAVGLVENLALAGPLPSVSPRKRIPRRVYAWAGSLAAACLAIAVVPGLLRAPEPDPSTVARVWSDLRVGADPDWVDFVDADPSPAKPVPADPVEGSEASTDRPLPSWLLSAASAPPAESPREGN